MRTRVRQAWKSSGRLGDHGTFSVGYQYVRGLNLIMSVNQNVPTCLAVGGNNGCRPNPDYANNSQYSSVADSNYHGLHLSLVQRPAAWGHYRVSYTYSKSMNNVGEFFFSSPIDPTDLSKDWGRSDDDQRHRLVVSGSASLPFQVQLSSSCRRTHRCRSTSRPDSRRFRPQRPGRSSTVCSSIGTPVSETISSR